MVEVGFGATTTATDSPDEICPHGQAEARPAQFEARLEP